MCDTNLSYVGYDLADAALELRAAPGAGRIKRDNKDPEYPVLVGVEEAGALIAARAAAFPVETCPLDAAHGRVLRETVPADRPLPPCDRVTVDGYALSHEAWAAGTRTFAAEAMQAAGEAPKTLGDAAGGCIEVMTGAALPRGCDCVVRVEDTEVRDGRVTIASGAVLAPGLGVHRKGSDRSPGAPLLTPGRRLDGPAVGVAASVGKTEVCVTAEPVIAVITTGDELVRPEAAPLPHEVRRSNGPALRAMLLQAGWSQTVERHLRDDPAAMAAALREILAEANVLVLTGGVSMGRRDYVPAVLRDLGVEVVFHKVRQRPGKPMWFGVGAGKQMVFALPGNPVSALVGCRRYVLPRLAASAGVSGAAAPMAWARLGEAVTFRPALTYFLPVRIEAGRDGGLTAWPRPVNTSGDFAGLAESDGFVELPEDQDEFPAGYAAPLYRWTG